MTVSIMQPTYLPWAGYFNLIARVGVFVFLDDVQFAKPSWQMRNRILHRGVPLFLTVPTQGSRNQLLEDVRIAGDDFRVSQQKTLEHAYRKHPFGPEMLDALLPILGDRTLDRLVELNIAIIRRFSSQMGLLPRFCRSSQYRVAGKRSFHLLELLRTLGETQYLSPEGSRDYITFEDALSSGGVSVEYQKFSPSPYPQRGAREFVSHLSIVDVIANLGFAGARDYVSESETLAQYPNQPLTALSGEPLDGALAEGGAHFQAFGAA
jgi:WbqC-like protein family